MQTRKHILQQKIVSLLVTLTYFILSGIFEKKKILYKYKYKTINKISY